jgi:hypothetical protein
MSLEHLFTTKNAQFFRPNPRRRITKTAATEIIKKVSTARSGKIQDKKIRESLTIDGSAVHLTYVCFPIESEPTFLVDSGLRETKYAYLLLVETPETIAVFKRNVEGGMQALSPFVLPWKYQELGGVYAADNPAFEKISLKTMSLAGHVVRRRSLEADNLAESMAVAGVHRSIPSSFRTRGREGTHSIAPGSARISRKDTRAVLNDLIRWVMRTSAELKTGGRHYSKTFLAEFCTAVPLADLPSNAKPNAILFDFSELMASWEDTPGDYEFALMRSPRSETQHVLSEKQIQGLWTIVQQVLTIDGDNIIYVSPRDKEHVIGRLRVNKNSISIRSGLLERLLIRCRGEEQRLSTYTNQENNFLITFSEPEYGYGERQLFQDIHLLGSIDSLLRVFEPQAALSTVTAEKAPSKSEFKTNGIFRWVEDNLAPGASLVCDDLGDEWADYVAIDMNSSPPRLQFIHCKHGKKTTSASGLQEPIGQAIKNLSRMFRGIEFFTPKINGKWRQKYSTTQIPRIRRGVTERQVEKALSTVLSDPNTERSVVLVLSSISLKELSDVFNELKAGTAKPHVSQLLWILSGLISACREHGVRPHVICQP